MMKSGSPIMIVGNLKDGQYWCNWWSPIENQVAGAFFSEHLLMAVHGPSVDDALKYQIQYVAAYKGGSIK